MIEEVRCCKCQAIIASNNATGLCQPCEEARYSAFIAIHSMKQADQSEWEKAMDSMLEDENMRAGGLMKRSGMVSRAALDDALQNNNPDPWSMNRTDERLLG